MRKVIRAAVAVALTSGSMLAVSQHSASAVPQAGGPDYNCDGYADLAVGVPGWTINGAASAGVVEVFWGTNAGLNPHASVLYLGAVGAPGTPRAGDAFGASLVSGNFDDDVCTDLAVGAPGVDLSNRPDAGAVYVFLGDAASASGFDAAHTRTFVRGSGGVPGVSQRGAQWGRTLAAGDANGDFTDDLAVGAPLDDVGSAVDAGSVVVLQDPGMGHSATGTQWTEGANSVPGSAATNDHFGAALAFGNFTLHDISDFSEELAIGVPGANADGVTDSGAVDVLAADATGVTGTGSVQITQDTAGVPDTSEPGDVFGATLAAGPLLGSDDATDLAIGAPFEDTTATDAGKITVLGGGANGLLGAGAPAAETFYEGAGNIPNAAEVGDRVGYSLTVAHFDGNAGDGDLVIGVPFEDVGSVKDAGAIAVVPSNMGDLDVAHAQFYSQGNMGVSGVPEAGDEFGLRIAAGDFHASGVDDLAVGAPYEDVGSHSNAGFVNLLHSDGQHLHPSTAGGAVLYQGMSGVPGQTTTGALFGML